MAISCEKVASTPYVFRQLVGLAAKWVGINI